MKLDDNGLPSHLAQDADDCLGWYLEDQINKLQVIRSQES